MKFLQISLIVIFLLLFVDKSNGSPSFPTFLILSIPIMEKMGEGVYKSNSERVDNNFIRWLQASGADVIVVSTFTPKKEIEELLTKVNGIIFQGNDLLKLEGSTYFSQALYLYERVKEIYDQSQGQIKIPLVAFGNDLSMISEFVAGTHSIIKESIQLWLNEATFINKTLAQDTIIYSELDEDDMRSLEFLYHLPNELKFFVPFGIFENNKHLKGAYHILTHSTSLYGINYVSSIQDKKYPIAGVSFRPEATAFEQGVKPETNPSWKSVKISRFIGNSLVKHAMQNNRTMTIEEKKKYNFIDPYKDFPVIINGKYQHIFKRKK